MLLIFYIKNINIKYVLWVKHFKYICRSLRHKTLMNICSIIFQGGEENEGKELP